MLAATAVALGAFGAHGLKARLSAEMLAVWHTAVQYHAWHALGLLAIGLPRYGLDPRRRFLPDRGDRALLGPVLWTRSVTPLGGAAFILGWLAFAVGVIYARTPA